MMLRAYDTTENHVSSGAELPQTGHIGMATLTTEANREGGMQMKLQDVLVSPSYQNAGIAENLLEQSVEVAREKGASHIYGDIQNNQARSFWKHMEEKGTGWTVDEKGPHGQVNYDLSGQMKSQSPSKPVNESTTEKVDSMEESKEDENYHQGYSF